MPKTSQRYSAGGGFTGYHNSVSTRRQWLRHRRGSCPSQVSEGQQWHAGIAVCPPQMLREPSPHPPHSNVCQAGCRSRLELWVRVWLPLVLVLLGRLFLSLHPLCCAFLPLPSCSCKFGALKVWRSSRPQGSSWAPQHGREMENGGD